MASIEVRPFSAEHLEAAGELLAERHRRHRSAEPLLPGAFEDPVAARGAVEVAWDKEGASGAVAFRDGRVIGYLIGAPEDEREWGPNDFVEVSGHAVLEPKLVRDLYTVVAEGSLAGGRHRHYALVPASDDELLDAWYQSASASSRPTEFARCRPRLGPMVCGRPRRAIWKRCSRSRR